MQFSAAVLAAMIAVTASGMAAEQEALETYKVFLTRNPFGLKDPPPPVKPPTTEPVPAQLPSDLKLTGMRALKKGTTRVMFVQTPPGEDPEFLSIEEGNRKSGVEVLAGGVNIEKGTVRVKVNGAERTLSFEDDGYEGGGAAKGGRAARPIPGRNAQLTPRATPVKPSVGRIPPPPSNRAQPSKPATRSFPRPIRTGSNNRTTPLGSSRAIPAPTASRTVRLNAGGQLTSVNPPKPKQTMNAVDQEIVMRATQLNAQQNPQMLEVAPGKFIKLVQPPLPPPQQ